MLKALYQFHFLILAVKKGGSTRLGYIFTISVSEVAFASPQFVQRGASHQQCTHSTERIAISVGFGVWLVGFCVCFFLHLSF